ncbi:hypothetical protein FKW77_010259 [Venturia effusa]|uniref:Aminoglycoside phosphotransferase domain-containing protein n=1 Tax=Venturia effusa TaxID=50376 RepID=A0A517L2A4_9PEZI|nr:hypothetical protein FKW77_010259 [Venturia effusa]
MAYPAYRATLASGFPQPHMILSNTSCSKDSTTIMMPEQHDLEIDNELQGQIFPNVKPKSLTPLLQTWTKCICVAHFDGPQAEFVQASKVVVRVEDGDLQQFEEIAALQHLGSLAAPHLVPATFRVGTGLSQGGKKLAFSITAYVEGVVLTEVYDSLGAEQREAIMDESVVAVKSFYNIRLSDEEFIQAHGGVLSKKFQANLESSHPRIGGPRWGYFHDARSFLESVVKRLETWDSRVVFKKTEDGGVLVEPAHSSLKHLQAVYISQSQLLEIESGAVMSFMDLEPRNIMVSEKQGDHGAYEVAGIIDWEMAGFFPLGFEQIFKDSQCGCANAYFDWYRMFRDRTNDLVSSRDGLATAALFEVMDMARQSYLAQERRNFGLLYTRKWIEEEALVLDGTNGWIREPGTFEAEPWSEKKHKLLEAQVATELGLPWS